MSERVPNDLVGEYAFIGAFPKAPLTEEEISLAVTKWYRRLKHWADENPENPLAQANLKMLFPAQPTEEEIRDFPDVVELIEEGTQEVRGIVNAQVRKDIEVPVLEQYHFRKQFEEGTITKEDVNRLLGLSDKVIEAAKRTGELAQALTQEPQNLRESLFRKGIVHLYSVFDGNVDQVEQVVMSATEAAMTSSSEVGNGPRRVLSILTKATEIYEKDKNFYAVENYFKRLGKEAN